MKPEDLKATIQETAELLHLLDKFYPDRIDADTVSLVNDLAQNDLAIATLFKGTEFFKQAEGKPAPPARTR